MKQVYTSDRGCVPAKIWTDKVEDMAMEQIANLVELPFIHKHVAVMPDVHAGYGSTVGSVIPTKKAIIPAAVGVDIGCGMMAVRTTLTSNDMPDSLATLRSRIEQAVPHGFETMPGYHLKGGWEDPSDRILQAWLGIRNGYDRIVFKHPKITPKRTPVHQVGTLGGGNHFIEICLDEDDRVWIMLHSGSRGIGNKIGTYFTELARQDMRKWMINLPEKDLAYFPEGTEHFDDYWFAMQWAQNFAMRNREMMMRNVMDVMYLLLPAFGVEKEAINCHHNYAEMENHFGQNVYVTRKGAVRARAGDLGIIPGSMGARSYIVEGLGNPESFHSCSHGAGRTMSRTKAKATFTTQDLEYQTQGVECKKDESVLDESPGAYKDIDEVMAHQADLVRPIHTLRQIVCVKG